MRNDKILTAGQLYTLTSGVEFLLGDKNGDCCVCGVPTDKGFRMLNDRVVSDNYGEFSDYAADSNVVCPVCRALFSNDNRQKRGVLMHYASSDDCSLRFIVGNEKAQTNSEYLSFSSALETVLKPPKGYFAVAFNRFDSTNGTHFMPFAVVNYNPYGNCSKYYATVFTKVVMIDVEFLSEYVAKAMSLKRKIANWEIPILLKYANGIDADRKLILSKKIEKIPELLEFASIGLEVIQRNAAGISLVNKLFSIKSTSKKQGSQLP
jgi:hypothetical protein